MPQGEGMAWVNKHPPEKGRHVKRILATGSIAAFAILGFAGNASAAPAEASCFGQVHKTVNSGGVPGFDNVGELVQALGGGQAKNETAETFC
jgi:hypothetical protein